VDYFNGDDISGDKTGDKNGNDYHQPIRNFHALYPAFAAEEEEHAASYD
jgi:hypothetical protein